MTSKKSPKGAESKIIDVVKISFGILHFNVLGTTPFVINRMAEKAKQELLFPSVKKNRAGLTVSLKHHPTEEFRSSIYRTSLDSSPTRIFFPGSAFSSAIADTAVDIPGATRAQVERLVRVTELNVPLFGIPKVYMAIVRTAGMSRTPDVRTRAILPEWACVVAIRYVKGLITEKSVTNLFAAAGVIGGVGDGRGKMGMGQFRLATANDKDFLRIIKTQGRIAQDRAIEAGATYDPETEELYSWFKQELIEREKLIDDDTTKWTAPPRARGDGEVAEEELV